MEVRCNGTLVRSEIHTRTHSKLHLRDPLRNLLEPQRAASAFSPFLSRSTLFPLTSTPPQPRAIVLLSGGLDSATVLAIARQSGFLCHTLAFDYGQRHRHELIAAEQVSRALGAIDHRVVAIDLRAIGGSALTANIDVPKDRPAAEMSHGIPITYVPARNLVFLSLAAGYAEVTKASDIFIGVNAIDYSGYPDCRPEFIAAFESAANLGTKAGVEADHAHRLKVHAPLSQMTKADIITRGVALGVNYAITHSCYDPVPWHGHPAHDSVNSSIHVALACGHCDSCTLRRDGFRAAGVPDPTCYA